MINKRYLKLLKKIITSNWFKIFIFLLTLYFTFVIRAHNYEKTPNAQHLEEMMFAWSGMYILDTGTPVAWSTLDYPKEALVYTGKIDYKGGSPEAYVDLYKPWLDQPPLFSLLIGYASKAFGADKAEYVPSAYVRFPMIFIAALTSIAVFWVMRKLSGYWMGILAMLLYGSIPIIVFASRTAVPENVFALLLLITIWLLLKFKETGKISYLLITPIMAGLAGLMKPTGFFVLPLILFFVFQKRLYKYFVLLTLMILPFIGFFYYWGYIFDWEIFWRINSIQSNRPVGFGNLSWFFISPAYFLDIINDGWFVFCLLFAAFLIFKEKKEETSLVVFTFIYWVMIVMISSGETDLLPWYRFPVYPLMAIMGAWGIRYIYQQANIYSLFLASGLLLSSRTLIVNAFRPNIYPMEYRLIFSGIIAPGLLQLVFEKKFWQPLIRVMLVIIITIGLYINTYYIYNQYSIVCDNLSCILGPTTALSEMHFPLLWRFYAF